MNTVAAMLRNILTDHAAKHIARRDVPRMYARGGAGSAQARKILLLRGVGYHASIGVPMSVSSFLVGVKRICERNDLNPDSASNR
jgi:hypothetical protein